MKVFFHRGLFYPAVGTTDDQYKVQLGSFTGFFCKMPAKELFATTRLAKKLTPSEALSKVQFHRSACCLWPVLLLGASSTLPAAELAGNQAITACSNNASDESSIAECVALKFEQAEVSLQQIEQSWQRLLQTETVQAAVVTEEDSNTATAAESTSDGTNVIAIVNDTALSSGASSAGGRVINIDNDTVSGSASGSGQTTVVQSFDSSADLNERFGFLPALFRSYRDQHCAWQASVFGEERVQLHYQACLTSLTQDRIEELTTSLALQRSISKSGRGYNGYYVKTETGAVFQSCDRKTDWWLTGGDSVLNTIERRYLDINAQSVLPNDLLYTELSGTVVPAPGSGPGADFNAAISVARVSVLRPVSSQDCIAGTPVITQGAAPAADDIATIQTQAATVDDFASSGFIYGYFNAWQAACSVTQNSVCSAVTDAQFASDGEWQLRVDRSLEGDWRVMLIPTTDDQVIEKQLTLQINGSQVLPESSYEQPLLLALRQGRTIADGEPARELIAKLRQGREFRLQWFDEVDVMSELAFSLLGITRALEYFDTEKQ